MTTTLISTVKPSDWLKDEAESDFSREQGILLAGGIVKSGTVLGRITASGKLTTRTVGASDGSQNVVGLLLFTTDATSADQRVAYIARHAIVTHHALTRGSDVTTSTARATENASLQALGILVREGA